MLLLLFLASCANQCTAGVQQIAGSGRWSARYDCGPYATATIQVIEDKVYAVCSCPCTDEPVVDDLREPPERIEHR